MDFRNKKEKEIPISCIYIIYCKDLSIPYEYVGKTTNLTHRMTIHKASVNNKKATNYHLKLYEVIRNTGGYQNWEYNILEICNDKKKLTELEKKWIKQFEPFLNVQQSLKV